MQPCAWLVVVAFVMAACNAPVDREETAASEDRGRSPIAVSRDLIETLRSEGTAPEVLELMEDGDLTFEEYEQAVFGFVRCKEDYGWVSAPGFPRLTPWGSYQVRFEPFASRELGASEAEVVAWIRDCTDSYWRAMARLWNAVRTPTETEMQDARAAFASCLRARGVDVEAEPPASLLSERLFHESQQEAPDDLDDWVECYWIVDEQKYITGMDVEIANASH